MRRVLIMRTSGYIYICDMMKYIVIHHIKIYNDIYNIQLENNEN